MFSVRDEPGLHLLRTPARTAPTEARRIQSRSLMIGSSLAASQQGPWTSDL